MKLEEYMAENGINQDLRQEIEPLFTLRKYKKGDMLLHMGENTRVVCLILQGIVRGVYIDGEGVEITKCFSREGDWCCFYNMLRESPSEFWIEALEECQTAEIEVIQMRRLIEKHQKFRNLYEAFYRQAFLLSEEKGTSFQKMNAGERYDHFIKKYPDMEQRVKQEYIASYIGITPSSLSRLKRKL